MTRRWWKCTDRLPEDYRRVPVIETMGNAAWIAYRCDDRWYEDGTPVRPDEQPLAWFDLPEYTV